MAAFHQDYDLSLGLEPAPMAQLAAPSDEGLVELDDHAGAAQQIPIRANDGASEPGVVTVLDLATEEPAPAPA